MGLNAALENTLLGEKEHLNIFSCAQGGIDMLRPGGLKKGHSRGTGMQA